jgi:hypothetical protein
MLKLSAKILVLLFLFSMVAVSSYSADITTGLVGYWPLDGNAKEKTGKGGDGIEVGKPLWDKGRYGQAVKLDGVAQRIDLTKFVLASNNLTLAVWINGWKTGDWTGIMMSRGATADGIGFGDNNTLHYTWNADSTWSWALGPIIPQNTWAMVAISIDPKAANAYVFTDKDGVKSATNTVAHAAETISAMQIGNDACCAGRWFVGLMDEAIIYNRPLTKDDIVELATKGLTAAVESKDKTATTWGSIKN